MDWQQTTLNPAGRDAFWQLIRTPVAERDPALLAKSVAATERLLETLDGLLAARTFIAGEHFTCKSLHVSPVVATASRKEKIRDHFGDLVAQRFRVDVLGQRGPAALTLNEWPRPRTVAWTYDAATRRLDADDLAYDLDEVGHIVRVFTGAASGQLTPKYTHHYDAHGRVDSTESYTPLDETLFLNTYDGDRLIMVETGSRSTPTTAFVRFTYRYHDRAAPHMWTRIDIRISSSDLAIERTIVDGRGSTTRTSTDDILIDENAFIYADDRIETLDLTHGDIRGLEAAPYQRYHWVRD